MDLMRLCGHSFVRDFIGTTPIVLDCGANRGIFSTELAGRCRATVYGFEPDPRLFRGLPEVENVRFYDLAVSAFAEDMTLNLGMESCSSARFSEGEEQTSVVVKTAQLDAFCREKSLSRIDLLKLDIEGSEIEVLGGLPQALLAVTGQITVEFHDFLDIAERPRIRQVIRSLQASGFHFIRFSHHDYSDCLFVNSRQHPLGAMARIELLFKKYYRGISRKLAGPRQCGQFGMGCE